MGKNKKRQETLLLKYGSISLSAIIITMAIFLIITTRQTRKPVQELFDNSINSILDQSVDYAQSWLDNQIEALNIFQRAVIDDKDSKSSVKEFIKIKGKPKGFDYVMVFFDEDTDAKDGGPCTYNTKGGMSDAGILQKEYVKMHKSIDCDFWLESPRQTNTGTYSMPLFTKTSFIDENDGHKVTGGFVGFLELDAINILAKKFYTTGQVSIYDDNNDIRAGEDVLNYTDEQKADLLYYTKDCQLANKTWTVVATVNVEEVGKITGDLQRNSVFGGSIVAIILLITVLIIIRVMIGKFNSIKNNIDNLNTGDKDLTKRLKINHNNEISQVKISVNTFVDTVHSTVKGIGEANDILRDTFEHVKESLYNTKNQISYISAEIEEATNTLVKEDNCVTNTTTSVTEISENIKKLNFMIESQSAAITEASASIEQMIGNINSVSNAVDKMSNEFSQLNTATQDGIEKNRIVNELLVSVLAQSKSLEDTNKIISNISSQTNLLSMNAMIESAHAGDAGKGFAVVAEEIRKLADTSATQSKSIGENLKTIAENITQVVESANASKLSFEVVSEKTNNTSELVDYIKRAMTEQTAGSKQILDSLTEMNNSSNDVQTSSKEIEERTNSIINSVTSLQASSNNMSKTFNKIVDTAETTKKITEDLMSFSNDMTNAVDNISKKIDEFKV